MKAGNLGQTTCFDTISTATIVTPITYNVVPYNPVVHDTIPSQVTVVPTVNHISMGDSIVCEEILPYTINDIDLKSAASFCLLANGAITTDNKISGKGDIGSNTSISTDVQTNGSVYGIGPAVVSQAISDAVDASSIIEGLTADFTDWDLTSNSLAPGVYDFTSYAHITGDITLTGNESDIYVFRIADSLLIDTNITVFRNNIKPENIFWYVKGPVTLSPRISVQGIIISDGSIAAGTNNTGFLSLFAQEITLSNLHFNNTTYLYSQLAMEKRNNVPSFNDVVPCFTDEYSRMQLEQNNALQDRSNEIESYTKYLIDNNLVHSFYRIPVVVHIIHSGQLLGTGTNISDDQVFNAIDVLNREFREVLNNTQNSAGGSDTDMDIEFCIGRKC